MAKENKYQEGKIYKITCEEDVSKVYIGSTYQKLAYRLKEHINAYQN